MASSERALDAPEAGTEYFAPNRLRSRRVPFNLVEVFLFIAPLLQFIQFKLGGQLFGTDIVLFTVFPIVFVTGFNRLARKPVAPILILALFWLASQVLTDVLRSSSPEDYLRGWSKITLTFTHMAVIYVLIRGSVRRFTIYGVGVCVGGILGTIFTKDEVIYSQPWKFGVAVPVTLLVLFAVYLFPKALRKPLTLGAMIAIAAVNVAFNYRSMGVICLVTGIYSYYWMQASGKRRRVNKSQMAMAACLVLLSVWGFSAVYQYAAKGGLLGRDAEAKYEDQEGGEGGVLLGGRSEILGSGQAIIDSPILGHGSWARDRKYAELMRANQADLGYKKAYDSGDDLIPTHSHIFGAWVEAGILGAFFWFWIQKVLISTMARVTGSEPLLPVFAYISFLFFWDILFSPFGADRRFMDTFFIVAILLLRSLSAQTRVARLGESRC